MPSRPTRYLLGALLLALSLQAQSASAQSTGPGQIAPQYNRIDQNGIDLGTGQWAGQFAHIAIGDPTNGGMQWTQPANGPDSLSAIMIYGPGGNQNVSPIGFILNGNAAILNSDGNFAAGEAASCTSSADVGVPWDSDMAMGTCPSESGAPAANLTVGITVIYLGQMYHFYGLWNYYETGPSGNNLGQVIRFFELRSSGGLSMFTCIVGYGSGVWQGCTFTAHDGTEVNFPAFSYTIAPANAPQTPGVYQATNLVKPDGEIWTYYGSSSRIPGVGWAPGLAQFGSPAPFSPEYQTLLRPAAIVSNRGYTIKYLWDSTSVTDVVAYNSSQESCAPTASQCSFTHTWPSVHFSYTPFSTSTNQFILNVRDALNNTTTYTTTFTNQSSSYFPLTFSIKKPSGQTRQLTMDTNYIGAGVNSVTFGGPGNIEPPDPINTQHVASFYDGKSTWNYVYQYNYVDLHNTIGSSGSLGGEIYELYYLDLQLTRTDPLNGVRTVISSPIGAPLSDTDELNRATTFAIEMPLEPDISDIEGRVDTITNPRLDSTTLSYDGNNNVLTAVYQEPPSIGTDKLTTTYVYGNACPSDYGAPQFIICNSPTSVTDPKGNETDYQYDPVHGGIVKETLPADSNGVKAQIRNKYQQETAADQTGPIWLLTSSSTCTSATSTNPASCVGSTAEKVTSFAYDTTNNLRLQSQTVALGDGTNSATTSFGYDGVGNVTSVTDPNGNVSYVTYDVLRRKVFEIGADPGSGLPRPITHHVYDVDGNETRTETGTGFNTDGSDFVLLHHVERVFDPATGLLTQTSEVAP
jgi:YD repeat-containing protein